MLHCIPTVKAASILEKSMQQTRVLLQYPDKVEVTGGVSRYFYDEERVRRLAETLTRKKQKPKIITFQHTGGKGVHTWCVECGYPFYSRHDKVRCTYCEKGVERPQTEKELFFKRKKRSTPCPRCGRVRFVGQIYCSFCEEVVKKSVANDYSDAYPGELI